jgi:hypothetical protein
MLNKAHGQGYTAPRFIGFTPVSLPKIGSFFDRSDAA